MGSSQFEIVTTRMGALSIRDNVTQEIMHNPVGPWAEANALYIEQSHMRRRLTEDLAKELVIFDVGLGAAANALAALHCARDTKNRRSLRLVSFERDLELLKFALENSHHFDHFKGYEAAVQAILEKGHWQEEGIVWELRHGNFVELIEREPALAHIVFYDPYSSKKNQEMWCLSFYIINTYHFSCIITTSIKSTTFFFIFTSFLLIGTHFLNYVPVK